MLIKQYINVIMHSIKSNNYKKNLLILTTMSNDIFETPPFKNFIKDIVGKHDGLVYNKLFDNWMT